MYLYRERFQRAMQGSLNSMNVTDLRMRNWFLTTFVTCLAKDPKALRTVYVGTRSDEDLTGTPPVSWGEAPPAMRQAVINGELIREVKHTASIVLKIEPVVRAMKELLVERPTLTDFSKWDLTTLETRGKVLYRQEYVRSRDAEAEHGFHTVYANDEGYCLVAVLNHAALDLVGDHLLNCLRGVFATKSEATFGGLRTYFAVKYRSRFISLAEVSCSESALDPSVRNWLVLNHEGVSNTVAPAIAKTVMSDGLTAYFGASTNINTFNDQSFHRKALRLIDGEPMLAVLRTESSILSYDSLFPMPRSTARIHRSGMSRNGFLDLLPHQRSVIDMLQGSDHSRVQFSTRVTHLWTESLRRFLADPNAPRIVIDSLTMFKEPETQDEPEVDVTRPPELRGKRQQHTLNALKHRAFQRNTSARPPSLLLAGLTKRIKDQ